MADSVKFVAGGTVQAGGGIYIRRRADQELLALCRSGAFAYVLTPRQMGKSSLMVQTANALKEQGIRSVTVDLTKIGTLLDAEAWYLGLLTAICRKFGLMRNLLKWWQAHKYLGITQRFTQFIDEVMLTEVSERIVIFVDEIDTTLNLDFTDDFFAAIRSFYLDRAENPAFARLSFVLIGVATPSDLIKNSQRTPFNIGQRVDLTDFTFEEGLPLADGFKLPIEKAHQLLKWIIKWTGGHPYLTQRLCRELVNKKLLDCSELEIDQLVNTLFLGDKSTQDNNLNFVRDMLVERTPDLAKVLTIYRDICNERRTILDDERSIFKSHLKLAGVVVRHNDIDGFKLIVRNRIYKEVFNVAWATKNLPINTMLFGEAVETDQNYSYVLGGTVQSGGGVYIPRKADRELLELCRSGTFAYVLTPRQTGKSSLLANVASDLAQAGIRPIKVDLAAVGTQIDAEAWYLGLLTIISRQLDLQRQLMKWWKNHKHLGITQRLTQFIEEVILGKVSERIVIFIDEIDTTLNLDFTDDFFIAIRSLYSARAENSEFERLSFVLFGVATPSDLILSPQRTPFNIGQRVDLTDFTFEEALPLADGFDLPTEEAQQLLQWVLDWTAGHPYLTQRFCKELRKEHLNKWSEVAVAEVVKKIFLKDASKQDTNLQFVRDMLTRRSPDTEKELNTYREVLLGKHKVTDEEISLVKSHLKLSGVVKRSPDGVLQVRNKIYRQVFDLAWVKENLPINWLKSLRRAAVTSTIIFLVATAPLGIFAEFQRRVAVNRGDELEKRGIELEERSNQLEIVLADAEEARKDAELARQNEAKQRKLAEEGRQKAEIERKRAEKAKQEEEIALKAEERERKKAVVARNAEAKQRTIAEQEKRRAENFAVVANIRENSTRALNYLLTARAVEGLILAMHATIQTQELSSDIDPKLASDLLSLVASTLLKAEEAVKEQMIFRGHEGEVLTAAFSPDDQMIVSGGVDNTVRLWDLRGNQIGDFLEHESDVVGVSFSSDGQKIIAVGRNGVVKQWSISGTPIDSFEAITSFDVVSVSYSADGQIVAVSLADGSVAVGNLSGTGWQEWIVNQPLVRVVDASLDENHEVVESENKLVDVYPIVGTAGQEIEISMESEDFDTYLILENSEKERIKEDDDGGDGSNSFMNVILPEDGNYKIIATTYETNASGEYQITVDQLKVIESPLLREETTLDKKHEIDQIPVTSGDNYSGDSYLIQGDAGQEISISMESSKFDTYLILENSTGEIIAQDDDRGNGNNSLLRTVIPETGTYRIIATNVNNEEGSGLYSLQVNELERSQTSSVNKTSASLDEGDQVIQITTRIGDVYSFEGKQGQQITVNMESEDFDTQLILQTAEGKTIAENDDREGDTNSFLSTVLPVDGIYQVVATSLDRQNGVYNLLANTKPIRSISISHNSQRLATAATDGAIKLWDLQGNLVVNSSQKHQGEVLSVAFSSDGERIVSGGSDRSIVIWDSEGNSIGEPFQGHNGEVLSVAFSSDNQRIVSSGVDGTLRLWDLQGNQLSGSLRGHGSEVFSVVFSTDNQHIVSGSRDGTSRLWEGDINIPFVGHEDSIYIVDFSPDGQRIVSGSRDGTIRLWDLQGNQIGLAFQGHKGVVWSVAFSPDGQRIVSGSGDRTIRLWDLQGNQIGSAFQGHIDGVLSVAFSPNGQRIVSGSRDGTIRLWDLQSNQIGLAFQGHIDGVLSVAFSPDGQLIVSGSRDGTIRLWDLQGNQIGLAFQGHKGVVWSVAFSPDGQHIVSGNDDRTIRLWDLQGNQIGSAFQGHEDDVNSVLFSPDGQLIVSGSDDRTIRLWDLQGNQIGSAFQGHKDRVWSIAFSPDGQRIASASSDNTLLLWWASWKGWFQNSCKRLQHHPILRKPDESLGEEFRNIASEVRAACDQKIWEQY